MLSLLLLAVDGQSCSFPLEVDPAPSANVGPLNPCLYSDDTGRRIRDAVMRAAPSDAFREITVETFFSTFSTDTYLSVYTACPAFWYSTAYVSESWLGAIICMCKAVLCVFQCCKASLFLSSEVCLHDEQTVLQFTNEKSRGKVLLLLMGTCVKRTEPLASYFS